MPLSNSSDGTHEQQKLWYEKHEQYEEYQEKRLQKLQAQLASPPERQQAPIAQIPAKKKWVPSSEAQRRWIEELARLKKREEEEPSQSITMAHHEIEQACYEKRQAQRQLAAEEEARKAAEKAAEAFPCRRCPAKFPSNTKLHQHIGDHHAKKPKPDLPEASTPAPIVTKTPAPPSVTILETLALATPPATPPETTSEPAVSIMPITPPATTAITPPSTPTNPAVAKSATPKPSGPSRHIFMPPTPPQTPVLRLANHVTKKPYMTIDDLYAMFAGKDPRKNVDTIQTSVPARQMRITAYFKPQTSGTAKPFSTMSSKKCQKWSPPAQAISPPPATASQSTRALPNQRAAMPQASPPLKPPHFIFSSMALSCSYRSCRFCHGTFSSNNSLHRHLRASHLAPASSRRCESTSPVALHLRHPGPVFVCKTQS